MMKRNFRSILFAQVLILLLAGCASQTYKAHPGSANNFDSQSYDALLVAHNVIEQTKSDLASNVFPANIAPKVKAALNGLITAYNSMDTVFIVYHTAAINGTATQGQADAVSAAQSSLNNSLSNLSSAKAGK